MPLQLIGGDMDGVKKERQAIQSKIKQLEDTLAAIEKEIKTLQDELEAVTQKREKAYENIQQLRKQRDEGVCFGLCLCVCVFALVKGIWLFYSEDVNNCVCLSL